MENIKYEIWALGYHKDNTAMNLDEYLGESLNLNAAIRIANAFDCVDKVFSKSQQDALLKDGDYLEIRIEKVNESNHTVAGVYSSNIEYKKEN